MEAPLSAESAGVLIRTPIAFGPAPWPSSDLQKGMVLPGLQKIAWDGIGER